MNRALRRLGIIFLPMTLVAPACGPTQDTIAISKDLGGGGLGGGPGSGCLGPGSANEGVVALYTFDEDEGRTRVLDSISDHHGSVQQGVVDVTAGPTGCASAFSITSEDKYFFIDDSPDWDLDQGSLDLWLWVPSDLESNIGVLSRDVSNRAQAGHVSVFVDENGIAVARVQPLEDGAGNGSDAVACSEAPVPRDQWFHLGLNFGPPAVELFIDGVLAEGTSATTLSSSWSCGQGAAWGIAGNDLPWVVGQSSFRSDEVLETLEFPLTAGAIDHLRISRVRRDFSTFF